MTTQVVQVINTEAPATKLRLIDIYKNEVYNDIDLVTHKHVDGSDAQDVRVRNAVSSDVNEDVDGKVIARFVMFWDARLRRKMQKYINTSVQAYADDTITLHDEKFIYSLNVPESFNDSTLRSLAEYIHRFLVCGALYDWFNQFGDIRQAGIYKGEMDELEGGITDMLRTPSIVKRPLQPFGPAKPIF